jgi:predicted nucleic acid-binding protein
VRRVVLDAPAFVSWFGPDGAGRSMRSEYEDGALAIHVPPTFAVDVLVTLERGLHLSNETLAAIAEQISRLRPETREPSLSEVARWVTRGLDSSQASYAALASQSDMPLVSADPDVLRHAAALARPVERW